MARTLCGTQVHWRTTFAKHANGNQTIYRSLSFGMLVANRRCPLLKRMGQLLKEGGIRLFAYRLCRKVLSPLFDYGSTNFFEFDLKMASKEAPPLTPFL